MTNALYAILFAINYEHIVVGMFRTMQPLDFGFGGLRCGGEGLGLNIQERCLPLRR